MLLLLHKVSLICAKYKRCNHWPQVAGNVEGLHNRDKLGWDITLEQLGSGTAAEGSLSVQAA
jgi:hypothetical protein